MSNDNTILPDNAISKLYFFLEKNEKDILNLYWENTKTNELTFTQEDIKRMAKLSTNDARVSLYKLEAVLFLKKNIKGRGNSYVLTENGQKIITSQINKMRRNQTTQN